MTNKLNNRIANLFRSRIGNCLAAAVFAGLAGVLIFSWFRYGHTYGGGDVGIPFYDPKSIFNIARFIWWESLAPGTAVPQGLTSVPFQFVQTFLQSLGLPFIAIQALFFWAVIFLMGYGMYLLALNVFGRDKFPLALLAGVFYELNPYMMVQVWHRFIHNTFFLAAALPFFFLFWRSWVKDGKYSALLSFLLANFIAVYLYGTMAFVVTVLILLLFIGTVEVFCPWKGFAGAKPKIARTLTGLVVWLAVHSWWLLPVFNVAPATLSSQHSVNNNLSALYSISSQTIIPYSILGINPFYLYSEADFGKIFDTYFFRVLPWILLVFLIPGFIVALSKKKLAVWPFLAVAAIIVSKGATSPFGYPYIFGFSNFFFLGVLRNPFEKLGILIPFSYAILFPLGVNFYLTAFRPKFKKFIVPAASVALILYLGVFVWPLWGGMLFGKYNKLAFAQVPGYYAEADQFIAGQKKDGRILHLPLAIDESATYYWTYGYKGVESSQLYFNSLPSISRGLGIGTVDNAIKALSYIFNLPGSEDKILAVMQAFGVKFVVLHDDMEWRGGYLPEPVKLKDRLEQLYFLGRKSRFEKLTVYELKDEYFNPKITLAGKINYVTPSESSIYWPWLLSSGRAQLLSPLSAGSVEALTGYADQLVAFPERVYKYSPQQVVKENLLGEMTAAKVLPDSPLYFLIRLKEKLQYLTIQKSEKFSFKITLLGKRLTEVYLLKQKGSTRSIIPHLREYQRILPEIKEDVQARTDGREGEKEISIQFILARHLATLNSIKDRSSSWEKPVAEDVINQLTELMKDTNVIPYNEIKEGENLPAGSRLISKFNLPVGGEYELLQAHEQIQDIYPDNLNTNVFQINNEILDMKGLLSGNFISYGMLNLPAGLNEISFHSVPSVNLAKFRDPQAEIEITSSQHGPSYFDINVEPIHGGDWYQLTFSSWIKLGDKFTVQVVEDAAVDNPDNPADRLPSYDNDFVKDPYINYWDSGFLNFYIRPAVSKATIRFLIAPWDGCRYAQIARSLCSEKIFRYRYEKISKVSLRDIKVVRLLSNPIFLRTKPTDTGGVSPGQVSFTKENPTAYSGKINLASPGFLIFNETFHPGWQLKLESPDGSKISPSQKFLANLYANAWYIEETGDYNFKLEFAPEKNIRKGFMISVLVFLVTAVLTIKQRLHR